MGLPPFFCHNGVGDPLATPPPAHCGIPPYQLDPKTMGKWTECSIQFRNVPSCICSHLNSFILSTVLLCIACAVTLWKYNTLSSSFIICFIIFIYQLVEFSIKINYSIQPAPLQSSWMNMKRTNALIKPCQRYGRSILHAEFEKISMMTVYPARNCATDLNFLYRMQFSTEIAIQLRLTYIIQIQNKMFHPHNQFHWIIC